MKVHTEGLPSEFITKVVGVSFSPNYPSNIYSLAKSIASGPVVCSLIREPKNSHDPNSIRVDIDGKTIGHLPRLISMIIARKIDSGESWQAQVGSIVISNENTNQPGLKIKVWRFNDTL